MLIRNLLRTGDDHALMLQRVILGLIFFAHGSQKALGWYGGPGLETSMRNFTGMGIPSVLAALAVMAEFLGGIGLLLGLLSRIAAVGIAVNMLVAILLVHVKNGFFMNWMGSQHGEGFEFHLLAMAVAGMIVVRGAGAWSLDRALERWWTGGSTWHIHVEPQPSE